VEKRSRQGVFNVIDSFAIKRRDEFYMIGNLKEGDVKENWFVNVPLNKSLSVTFRIWQIEDVDMSNEKEKYVLLIIKDPEAIEILLGLNIGSELLDITIEGED
jgi:hypothetical protein